jgi:hypothetical protein
MKFFDWLLVIVAAVAFSTIVYAATPKAPEPFSTNVTVVEYGSEGGEIFSHMRKYNQLNDEGMYLKIDGVCASACTYFLNLVDPDHVCATDKARFGFHGIYGGMMGTFEKNYVQFVHPLVYPQYILDWLKDKGFDGTTDVDREQYPMGLIWATREEVKVNVC